MPRLKTLKEVSKERDISVKTLRRWANQGMKTVKAGSIRLYDEWIDEYIENMANERAIVPNKTVTTIRYQPLRKIEGNRVY